jgi:molybdenum cofactor synthesis domain-containing protein
VLGACPPLPAERVALRAARGLVTAEEVRATEAIPAFANTAMDGYAVRSADVGAAPVELRVVGTVAAGAKPSVTVGAGDAVRIMTGAPIPPGADAVVMVEATEDTGDGRVRVLESVPAGHHIRGAGEDVRPGQVVLEPGTVLTPGYLGVLASLGHADVLVRRRPRVGVLSTGDELVEAGTPLEIGQIRDSNRHTLLALCDEAGFQAVDLGLAPDDEERIEAALRDGVAHCDAVLTSGGVSMGSFDYVKVVLDRMGEMRWMQIAIKPAKPLAFGLIGQVPVFGLPGNPVSSMVSFELFARPALRRMGGHPSPDRPRRRAVVEGALRRHPDGKVHFARVRLAVGDDGVLRARSAGGQGSHQLTAMAGADGLAVLPDGPGAADGDTVEVLDLTCG